MMFASILPVVIIDAPLPKIASTAEQVKQAKNTENKLEVTIYINSKGMQGSQIHFVDFFFGGSKKFCHDPSALEKYRPAKFSCLP